MSTIYVTSKNIRSANEIFLEDNDKLQKNRIMKTAYSTHGSHLDISALRKALEKVLSSKISVTDQIYKG